MAAGLLLAAVAGLLIPAAAARRSAGASAEPEHAEMAMVAGGTVVGEEID